MRSSEKFWEVWDFIRRRKKTSSPTNLSGKSKLSLPPTSQPHLPSSFNPTHANRIPARLINVIMSDRGGKRQHRVGVRKNQSGRHSQSGNMDPPPVINTPHHGDDSNANIDPQLLRMQPSTVSTSPPDIYARIRRFNTLQP